MPDILWISGGRVIDPANNRDAIGDVYIIDGKISDILTGDQKQFAKKIDATGLVVAPGLVDIHVHFRDPGQTHKESILTGTQAAAAGGFTSVVCMPNTSPVCDNAGTIQRIIDKVARDALINVYPTGCLTLGMEGERLAPTGQLKKAGVVAMTDNGKCVQSNEIMRRAVEYAKMFDLTIMDHCQDETQTEGAVMNEGEWSLRLGLRGWPKFAEDIMVARNVLLAELTGARIHMQHVSSATSIDIIRRAKERNAPVTAEACPHHFSFIDADLHDYDTNFKVNPPLRTEVDRQAIIDGLKDGTLDCIASDHAPHNATEKDCEFDIAPFGIIGLETSLAASLTALYHSGKLGLSEVVALMTNKAAAICKLDAGTLSGGVPADICIFNPDEERRVDANQFLSKSRNCPWHGQDLKGAIKATYVDGKPVFYGQSISA
ncbi:MULTISPECIES: dihydroorotase [unclassified Lentimonas]|uniref:dihydroorotase n=1 Tax=unclassified Lentimonas TaxID=2630993 RepID=UPI00132831B5|nr:MULTISPECIES: dihydroorotase [unclassified Lentimonas]CAA6677926.1 Dihydroorotase (EC [Lentimonas sp. CC4]CAA6684030.1 Dihydroorotase (EC [Lentimonas sp. CC6]CAA7076594.1 Dihydroorotase (EC [Lentimonas sp. CC4]CAA7170077.1 Dihydroorotase (EC [Lentimonas sp. CC21]CAA7181362.1 Dihydroorotase (EC [Lentimonas sp. CC8]